MNIKTGEKLILYVAVADRGNHIVSGSVVSKIGGSMQIRDDQRVQNVTNGCTPLLFNNYNILHRNITITNNVSYHSSRKAAHIEA